MKLADLKNLDVEATARAIEADMGEALPDIRQALAEAKAGVVGRVTTPAQILMRQARQATGLSQIEFARRIDTPVATLRDWEQGRFVPPGAVTTLARLIVKHPQWTDELAGA
jgi:putative transcriptional regulator